MFNRAILVGFVIVFCAFLHAQELTDKQRSLAGRYAQLEQLLLRLAETSGASNPQQATLLKKALLESKDKLLVQRFDMLVNALARRQFSDAVTAQTEIEKDLFLLLKLLENMSRDERREQEKEKIKALLKDVEGILQSERILKNQTQQQETQNLPFLESKQQDIRMRTQAFREQIAEHEGGGGQQTEDSSREEGQESTPQTPSQKTVHKTLERMKQAERRLQQAEKEGAIEEQEEAIAELQNLKEELEKILRQLREEELIQTLEKLETRFKRMLQQEQTIRLQTERLLNEAADELTVDQRQIKIRTDRLGTEQQSVIEDAESALLLLREDGTAQAMVESLLQTRFDMTEVKNRLEQTLLDVVTLHIEDAVIDALQEKLDAVQSAIAEVRERHESTENQQPQQSNEAEEPLIQLLTELRMIRSMQRRVNERTARYDDEIKQVLIQPDADLGPFKQVVEELARQQNWIARILHELKIGKTN